MKYMRLLALIGAMSLTAITGAHAQAFSAVALGANIGTYGIGAVVTTNLAGERLNINLGFSHFNYGRNFSADGTQFKADGTVGGESALLSLYPFLGHGFNIDGGLVINQNSVKATAEPGFAGTYTFNGMRYPAAEVGTVSGKSQFNTAAPYIGIGWGNPIAGAKRWTFVANAGAIYEGNPEVRLTASGAGNNPVLASSLAATENSVNSHLNWLTWYPIISMGLAYRF